MQVYMNNKEWEAYKKERPIVAFGVYVNEDGNIICGHDGIDLKILKEHYDKYMPEYEHTEALIAALKVLKDRLNEVHEEFIEYLEAV